MPIYRLLSLSVVTLSALALAAVIAGSASAHNYGSSHGTDPKSPLKNIAGFITGVVDRPSRVIYRPYPVSPLRGLVSGFVHVSDGTVVLNRVDLVVDGEMPITLRRAYDSSRTASRHFGQTGWHLTIDEEITRSDSAGYVYSYGNGRQIVLAPNGRMTDPLDALTSDVVAVSTANRAKFSVRTRTDLTKHFSPYAGTYSLSRVEDAFGNWISIDRTPNGAIYRIANSSGHSVAIITDDIGRIESAADDTGRFISYRYDQQNRLAEVADIAEQIWRYEYDASDLLIKTVTPNGWEDLKFAYDGRRRVTSARTNAIEFRYRYSGPETHVTDQLGQTTVFSRAPSGMTARVINRFGTVTEIRANALGLPDQIRRNNLKIAEFTYRPGNLPGPSAALIYDLDGSIATRVRYDGVGRVVEVVSRDSTSAYRVEGYEAGLVPTAVVFPDGTSDQITIGPKGGIVGIARHSGSSIGLARTNALWTVTGAKGRTATFEFNDRGYPIRVTPPSGPDLDFGYDDSGLRESVHFSDGRKAYYRYDASGNLYYSAAGYLTDSLTSYTYITGAGHRLEAIQGSSGDRHELEYYSNGKLASFRTPLSSAPTFRYDAFGRLTRVEFEGLAPLDHEYKPGEPDIVAQLSVRALPTYNQQREINEFGSWFDVAIGRIQPATFGAISYDELAEEFRVAGSNATWNPASSTLDTIASIQVELLLESGRPDLAPFIMPSNPLFVPREYWSVNCCNCYCEDHEEYYCNEP